MSGVGGGGLAVARVHVDGMTCGKCVNYIQVKYRTVRTDFTPFPNPH